MRRVKVNIYMVFSMLMIIPGLGNAVVVQIGIGDFIDPTVIDFESVIIGPISGTDALFTSAGITSITPSPEGADTDIYNVRTNSSRALGANSTGLFIADPGTAGAADTNNWEISFVSPQSRFGFGVHDQNDEPLLITLLLDEVQVGSLSISSPDVEFFQLYFESTVVFNGLSVTQNATGGFGFMLDNLTIESTSQVPVPAAVWLFGSGLLCLVGLARRSRVTKRY